MARPKAPEVPALGQLFKNSLNMSNAAFTGFLMLLKWIYNSFEFYDLLIFSFLRRTALIEKSR